MKAEREEESKEQRWRKNWKSKEKPNPRKTTLKKQVEEIKTKSSKKTKNGITENLWLCDFVYNLLLS